jgi:hypothetical protein
MYPDYTGDAFSVSAYPTAIIAIGSRLLGILNSFLIISGSKI